MAKRTYEVLGYRKDNKNKKRIDHLLIQLRIMWEQKEKAIRKKNFYNFSAREYLWLLKKLKDFGIIIKGEDIYGQD